MGFRASWRLRARLTALSGLSTGLQFMRSELAFREPPVPELMETLAGQTPEPVCRVFQACADRQEQLGREPFSAVWEQAVDQCGGLELTARERRELSAVGNILGRYDVDGQLGALGALHHRVEQLYDEAVRERENKGRVYSTLGVVTGLGLVILLV